MHDRIKQIREALNLSQREFGEKLGVSRDVISNIEYGRVSPKPLFIQHLCSMYNISEGWLNTGIGEMFTLHPSNNKNLEEANILLNELDPELQEYALKQIKMLLELQNSRYKESD